jgi:N-acetyl-anhydromuramyl-L-alanine amidase AmpD
MCIQVGREIVDRWPHIGVRDHHGHHDIAPDRKIDVAGFPFARVLRGIYADPTIPDVWSPFETVHQRQRALIALGFDLGAAGADGDWGRKSRDALLAFQRQHRMADNGMWSTFVNWKLHDVFPAMSIDPAQATTGPTTSNDV